MKFELEINSAAASIVEYLNDNPGADHARKIEITSNAIDDLFKVLQNHLRDQQLNRIENYLEAGFLAANFQHTEVMGAKMANQLNRYPKDIGAMLTVKKLDNDQHIIEPRMRAVNCAIWRHIQDGYGNGRVMQYFETTPPQINKSDAKTIVMP